MAYDKRYSDNQILRIKKQGRRQGLLLFILLYITIRYLLDLPILP